MDRLLELLGYLGLIEFASDDELATFVDDLRFATTEATTDATPTADLLASLSQVADGLDTVSNLQTAREEAAAALAAQLADTLARITPAPAEPEPVAPEPAAPALAVVPPVTPEAVPAVDIGEPVVTPEPVLAAVGAPATPARGSSVPLAVTPRAPVANRPVAMQGLDLAPGARVTVGAETFESSDHDEVWSRIRDAMIERHNSLGESNSGIAQKFQVAKFRRQYDPSRDFSSHQNLDLGQIDDQIQKIVRSDAALQAMDYGYDGGEALSAITAAGGYCGPLTPYYDQVLLADARRPVKDALTSIAVNRGGITYTPSMTLAGIKTNVAGGAITTHTNSQDIAGTVKTVQRINCGTATNAIIYSVVNQTLFGNLFARTSPEQVKNALALAEAAHSRVADVQLLASIDAASTTLTVGHKLFGASRDLLYQVQVAVAAYRQRHRAPRTLQLNGIFPEWTLDIFKSDLVRALHSNMNWWDVTDAQVITWLRNAGCTPFFTPDESFTGQQQIGGLNDYPDTVKWRLFHPGMFLFLDAGDLDLGLVRDSGLNSTNDFEMFSETFEGIAPVGLESLSITSSVCADGTSASTEDPGANLCVSHAATDNS